MPAPKPKSRPRSRQSAINVPAASRIATAMLTARSAGSGIGTGSLKNTMIPSPENWSRVPSNWLTSGPSALSALHYRVEFTELDAGVRGGELPIGPGSGGVAPVLPGLDVALQRRPVADPVRQVAAEGAQLNLGHVQPRAVLGGVVDLEPVGEALGLLGRERLVERGRGVGVELVHDQDELVCLAVAPVHQVAHEARPVLTPAPVGDRHLAPAAERLEGREQIGGTVAHVFAVVAFGQPRPVIMCRARRQRGAHALPISCLLHSSRQTTG